MSPAGGAGNPRSVPSPAAAGSPFAASPMAAAMSPSRPSPRSGSQAVAGLPSPAQGGPGSNNPGSGMITNTTFICFFHNRRPIQRCPNKRSQRFLKIELVKIPSSDTVHSNPGSRSSGTAGGVSFASRTLPQRVWAGANPTPLTQQALTELCKPCQLIPPAPNLYASPVQVS